MNKIKLSELFSSREYKEMELDPKIVDSILKKTIYRKRSSILSRAVLYLAPITAVIMIFVLYQNFFVEVQEAKNVECETYGGDGGGGDFLIAPDPSCKTGLPNMEKEKKGIFSNFSKDKSNDELKNINNNMDKTDYTYRKNYDAKDSESEILSAPEVTMESTEMDSIETNSVYEKNGLQNFDDDTWVEESSEGNHKEEKDINTQKVGTSPSEGGGGFFSQNNSTVTGLPGSSSGSNSNSSETYYIPYYVGGCIGLILGIYVVIRIKRRKK